MASHDEFSAAEPGDLTSLLKKALQVRPVSGKEYAGFFSSSQIENGGPGKGNQ